MNKIFRSTLIIMFVCGLVFVSGYYCLEPEKDNISVLKFKDSINTIAINSDLERGTSQESIIIKLKYFHPCKKW